MRDKVILIDNTKGNVAITKGIYLGSRIFSRGPIDKFILFGEEKRRDASEILENISYPKQDCGQCSYCRCYMEGLEVDGDYICKDCFNFLMR